MAHQRQLIRQAAKSAIVAENTAAATRVYETRMTPFRQLQLPAVAVYSLRETGTKNNTAPRELTRSVELEIVAGVVATADVDDVLDALCQQIERAMHRDPSLGGTCVDSFYTSSEIAVDVEGNKPIAMVSIIYTVNYRTWAPEAEDNVLPDDFTTAGITYQLSTEQQDADKAKDLLEDLDE